VSDGLSIFLVFSPHPRQEEFNLELAWSEQPEFPASLERPSVMPSVKGDEFAGGEAIVGFYNLFPRVTGKSHLGWPVWECSASIDDPKFLEIFVREDSLPVSEVIAEERVRTAISSSLKDIESVAMPYFSRLTTAKGVRLASQNADRLNSKGGTT
jgi:hypothetical protein